MTLNGLVIAQSVVAAVAAIGCAVVVLVSLAFRNDIHHQRERVLIGLALSNMAFSIINIIPIGYDNFRYWDNAHYCGFRGSWFGAKFMVALYEMCILFISLAALRSRAISRRTERVLHALFVAIALAATVIFIGNCDQIYRGPPYPTRYNDISNLFDDLLFAWFGLVAMAFILWIAMHIQLRLQMQTWRIAESVSDFVDDHQERESRKAAIKLQQHNYREIIQPLRYYVVAFLLFTIPAIILSLDSCIIRGGCAIISEFCLAFRSVVFVVIYLTKPSVRHRLRAGLIIRKLTYRLNHMSEETDPSLLSDSSALASSNVDAGDFAVGGAGSGIAYHLVEDEEDLLRTTTDTHFESTF